LLGARCVDETPWRLGLSVGRHGGLGCKSRTSETAIAAASRVFVHACTIFRLSEGVLAAQDQRGFLHVFSVRA